MLNPAAFFVSTLYENSLVHFDKQAETIDNLIDRLINRGLAINDIKKAKRYLTNIGFYRLSAYTSIFQSNATSRQFNKNTSFDDILKLYVFDRKLRLLLLYQISNLITHRY